MLINNMLELIFRLIIYIFKNIKKKEISVIKDIIKRTYLLSVYQLTYALGKIKH